MEFKEVLNKEELIIYNQLSGVALELGYKFQVAKTKDLIHLFLHPKTKERILKFSYSNKDGFTVSLKFNKTKDYSEYFHEVVRKTIEESNYRYTGCYGCGKCDGTLGYNYKYNDGKEYFRCYLELLELFDVSINNLDEIKKLLENQL